MSTQKKRRSQINVLVVYVATMLICLVVFGSCAVLLLDIFVTQPAKKKAQEELTNNPDSSVLETEEDYSYANETILFVGAQGETINGMAVIRVLPGEGDIKIVPVSKYTLSQVSGTSGTIAQLFESGGMTYLKSAVENAFGITCDKYIKISNDGFKALVEYTGGTSSYTFPEELYYKNEETGELTSFSQGPATRTLWGDDIRRILTYPLYADGERTRVQAVGELGASIINSGFLANAEELSGNLTNIFNTVFNNSDTDITSKSFKKVKPAYEHLLETSTSPATYRMAKGTWGDNGYFTVDPEFKTEIIEYFALNEQE